MRDDHCPVVVDFETIVCLPKAGNRQRKATKLCALRLRNQVCREAFQKDLEGIQGGTPCKHVDEHHSVCIRAIQDLARRHFENQKQGPTKHWISLRTWTLVDRVKVLRRLMRMVCERLKREQQRAALVRWRGVPCQMRERAVVAARGREAQLGLALQVFAARVKIAVRRDKRTLLQEHLDHAAEAADNGNVDEVYRLLKLWVKPRYKAPPPCVKLEIVSRRTPDEAAEQRRRQYEATFKGQVITCAELAAGREMRAEDREPCWGIVPLTVDEVLDLILSASRGKAPGVDGISAEVLGAGGRPMAMLLQPKSSAHHVEGMYHGNHPEWKEQDERRHRSC